MKDIVVNIVLIFDLQMTNKSMSNNYKSEKFVIQRFENDLLGVLVELAKVYAQSLRVFMQSSNFLDIVSRCIVIISR
jgi:hypothetical protein